MDWEWSEPAEASCLSCPLCRRPACFPSAERLLSALKSLTSEPAGCGVCGLLLANLPTYLQHLTTHLPPGPPSGAPPADQRQLLQSLTSRLPPAAKQHAFLHCLHCPRTFKTARGRASHVRSKHAGQNGVPGGPAGGASADGGHLGVLVQAGGISGHLPDTAGAGGIPGHQLPGTAGVITGHLPDTAGVITGPLPDTAGVSGIPGYLPDTAGVGSSLALLDHCLGSMTQDLVLPVTGRLSSQTAASLSRPSSVQGTAPILSGPEQAWTAQHELTACRPPLPLPTEPLPETRAAADQPPPPPPPPPGLARRAESGRRLRRLLQASHVCHDCGRVFRLRPGLEAHRRLTHGDGACEQCSVCRRRFTSGRRLQRHLASAHGLSPTDSASAVADDAVKESNTVYECSTCKKTFTTGQFLRRHAKLHTGETPYVCDICGRAFALQQSYHKHQQYHTAVRPYVCPQCGRAFRESATLQNHMRIHSGEKPWTCETCGKSFRQRITYVVHRRIHTGALPYTCPLCHAGFRYKVSLRAHKCGANDTARDASGLTSTGDQSLAGEPPSPPQPAASASVAAPEACPSVPPPPPPPPLLAASSPPVAVAAGPADGAPLQLGSDKPQPPGRPRVSRVLLRRLVHKLRSRQPHGHGPPCAVTAAAGHQAGPSLEAAAAAAASPTGPPATDQRAESAPESGDVPRGAGATPAAAELGSAAAAAAAAESQLDLQQLFDFPVPERSRPPLSPLHRAIESVARELANMPLRSPPAWQPAAAEEAAGISTAWQPREAAEEATGISNAWQPPAVAEEEAAGISNAWQPPAAAEEAAGINNAWQPPAAAEEEAAGISTAWQPPATAEEATGISTAWQPPATADDPADLDLLLSQLFDI